VKTSIRLALTSLAVCGITFAASGKPLPFMPKAEKAEVGSPILLAPEGIDGPTPGEEIARQTIAGMSTVLHE
jgi:hypothetical protein